MVLSALPDAAHLSLRICVLDPAREVAGSDRRRGHLDLAQRSQSKADDPEAERRERGEDDQGHEHFYEEQTVQSAVHVVQRFRGDEHRPIERGLQRGTDAVPLAAVPRANGEVADPVRAFIRLGGNVNRLR